MKRTITLKNYSVGEGACKCGCGAQLEDSIVFATQAFISVLERIYGVPVRHILTSGARCPKHNADEKGEPDSQHINRIAVDGIFQAVIEGKWRQIDNADIGAHARKSGLFGGIGYVEYRRKGKNLVHLDVRPRQPAVW